jgi:spore coat polysaccharide biosynthesis protein SpsF
MVGGLQNKKVAFIIQARMQSARLPGKILMPLPFENGKPLLSWIIDELKKSNYENKIIVATSVNLENNILASFCEESLIGCYRGEEENVLSRFVAIAKLDNYDCIVRLTADNPIIDISILENTIAYHFERDNDYTATSGLPTGMNFEVISSKTLMDIENHPISDSDKEHVTMFVRNNENYKLGLFTPEIKGEIKALRLTVDYASDYALLSLILSLSNASGLFGIKLIEFVYSKYPWLFEINNSNFQKRQFCDLNQEVNEAILLLEKFEFKNASILLKNNL